MANLSITAKKIKAALKIFAGVCLWRTPSVDETGINVEELEHGEIAHGVLNILKKKDTVMTISEIEEKLGISNLKIKKED